MSGALLASGKIDAFKELVEQTDFSAMPNNDRVVFVATLFRSFQKQLVTVPGNETCVEALHCLSHNLLPMLQPQKQAAPDDREVSNNRHQLIQLPYSSKIMPGLKGIVTFREYFVGPGSRKHEFGFRIQTALASSGWDVSLLSSNELKTFSSAVVYDFALIDIAYLNALPSFEAAITEILKLRKYFRKIILLEPDPWCAEHAGLFGSVIEHIDYIWGFTSDWPLLSEQRFAEKAILFPNVAGFDDMLTEKEMLDDWNGCTFSFVGSIGIPNLPRVFWALESLRRKLPIKYIITEPGMDDGLSRGESLENYAKLLAGSHVGINYVNRQDGSRILTGRTLEIISLKRLLLQETCPAMHSYFKEGEHFLEFSDIDELDTAIEFLSTHTKTAKMIASEGFKYYMEHYSGKKFVEHFQTLLG